MLNSFCVLGRPPNITLRVMSRIEQPFVMEVKQKDANEVLEGNDRFEVLFFKHMEFVFETIAFFFQIILPLL